MSTSLSCKSLFNLVIYLLTYCIEVVPRIVVYAVMLVSFPLPLYVDYD